MNFAGGAGQSPQQQSLAAPGGPVPVPVPVPGPSGPQPGGPPPPQFGLSNSAAIRAEIGRFESVHPNIYAIYDLIERVEDLALQSQIREHVISIEGERAEPGRAEPSPRAALCPTAPRAGPAAAAAPGTAARGGGAGLRGCGAALRGSGRARPAERCGRGAPAMRSAAAERPKDGRAGRGGGGRAPPARVGSARKVADRPRAGAPEPNRRRPGAGLRGAAWDAAASTQRRGVPTAASVLGRGWGEGSRERSEDGRAEGAPGPGWVRSVLPRGNKGLSVRRWKSDRSGGGSGGSAGSVSAP